MQLDDETVKQLNSSVKSINFTLDSSQNSTTGNQDMVKIQFERKENDYNQDDPYYSAITKFSVALFSMMKEKPVLDSSQNSSLTDTSFVLPQAITITLPLDNILEETPEITFNEVVRALKTSGITVPMTRDNIAIPGNIGPSGGAGPSTNLRADPLEYDTPIHPLKNGIIL